MVFNKLFKKKKGEVVKKNAQSETPNELKILVTHSCGKKVRFDFRLLSRKPICPKCKQFVEISDNLKKLIHKFETYLDFAEFTTSKNGINLKSWVPQLSDEEIQNGLIAARLILKQGENKSKGIPQDDRRNDTKFATESSRQALGEELCNAAEASDVNEVKRLLSQGAEPRYETGPKRANPLLLAAHKGHAKVVRVLVEAGADVNQANTDGLTPLIAASMNDHVEAVRVLFDNNADPNLQTVKDKYTALMFAKSKEVFKALLNRGANTALRNKWGDTVLELAQAHDNEEFIRLLESSKKADVNSPTEQKVRNIKELQFGLLSHGEQFDTAFETLFSYLKDKDPEIKSIASLYLILG